MVLCVLRTADKTKVFFSSYKRKLFTADFFFSSFTAKKMHKVDTNNDEEKEKEVLTCRGGKSGTKSNLDREEKYECRPGCQVITIWKIKKRKQTKM